MLNEQGLHIDMDKPLTALDRLRLYADDPVGWPISPEDAAELVEQIDAAIAEPAPVEAGEPVARDPRPIFLPGQFGARLLAVAERFMAEYEFDDGESVYHVPTDEERLYLLDAINGVFGDDEFSAILQTLYAAPAPHQVAEGSRPDRDAVIEECAAVADNHVARPNLLPLCNEDMNKGAERGQYEAAEEIADAIRSLASTTKEGAGNE
jgi:hypothetical protein